MNVYTGLFVSALAVMGYFFCTRKLHFSAGVTFLGEMAAISLCWCPTALLYNYLTYVLFLSGVILLYEGLTRENKWLLFWAGLCLGTNIFVRFSNLPEAALIVAVWAYGLIEALENKNGKGAWKKTVLRTGMCLAGYLTAVCVLLGYIHIKYGLGSYVEGIGRLFAMTDTATDYKPTAMLMGMVSTYVEYLYWMLRIGVFVILGAVFFAIYEYLKERVQTKKIKEHMLFNRGTIFFWMLFCVCSVCAIEVTPLGNELLEKFTGLIVLSALFSTVSLVLSLVVQSRTPIISGWVTICAYMVLWLYRGNCCSFLF
jgi:hypothetical protein